MPQHAAHTEPVEAVVFDYGNTLVEFGRPQFDAQCAAIEAALRSIAPDSAFDAAVLKTVRDRQIRAPYNNGFRENDQRTIAAEIVQAVLSIDPDDAHIDRIIEARYQAFLASVALPDGVDALLARLGRRYKLGVLSNYPCGRSIRDSVRRLQLDAHVSTIVVSGEVGWCKPHGRVFAAATDALAVDPRRCVFVGDNWLADIQGASKAGMRTVLTREYVPYERFEPQSGDTPPTATIARLLDLEQVLDAWTRLAEPVKAKPAGRTAG